MNGKDNLERMIESNLGILHSILSNNKNVLLDTNILSGPSLPGKGDIINNALRKNVVLVEGPKIRVMKIFLENFSSYVESFEGVVSVPEVIDEMSRFGDMCRNKVNFIKKYSTRNFITNSINTDAFDFFKSIGECSRRIVETLRGREINSNFQFAGNNIYNNFKNLVSLGYNFFGKREKISPDDGLVAGALTLLNNEKGHIAIVSNDMGVFDRIRIIASLYSFYKDIDSNMSGELTSSGMSFYSFNKNTGTYSLFGDTRNGGMKFYSHKSSEERKIIIWTMDHIKKKNLECELIT